MDIHYRYFFRLSGNLWKHLPVYVNDKKCLAASNVTSSYKNYIMSYFIFTTYQSSSINE